MALRTLKAFLAVALVAGTAQGEENFDMEGWSKLIDADNITMGSVVPVHYDTVVSPETFTFNEGFAWTLWNLLWPKETLGNAVIMYGYDFATACDVVSDQTPDVPAALAVPPQFGEISSATAVVPAKSGLYAVALYESIDYACENKEVVQYLADHAASEVAKELDVANILYIQDVDVSEAWANATGAASYLKALINSGRAEISKSNAMLTGDQAAADLVRELAPGYFSVDNDTVGKFANEIGKIQLDNQQVQPLLFSVGRLAGAGKGLELWAFCDEAQKSKTCLGHPEWSAAIEAIPGVDLDVSIK